MFCPHRFSERSRAAPGRRGEFRGAAPVLGPAWLGGGQAAGGVPLDAGEKFQELSERARNNHQKNHQKNIKHSGGTKFR